MTAKFKAKVNGKDEPRVLENVDADATGDLTAGPNTFNGIRPLIGSITSLQAVAADDFLPDDPAKLVEYGLAEVVVLVAAQAQAYRDHAATAPWTRPENEFVAPWGMFTAAEFALIARRHMEVYGTTREQLSIYLAQYEEGRLPLAKIEETRVAESERWIAYYETQNMVERARLLVLRQTGTLQAALR